MNVQTVQSLSQSTPKDGDAVLALIIICPECRTQRAFQIGGALEEITRRQSAGHEITTVCDDCRHKIVVQIVWVERKPGWTVRPIELEDTLQAADDMGLHEQRKES